MTDSQTILVVSMLCIPTLSREVGKTAEKVLDDLPCDIPIVKLSVREAHRER